MTTYNLSDEEWKDATFAEYGLVYVLRDTDTGELLKVGKTETGRRFLKRCIFYIGAAKRNKRNLTLDVFQTNQPIYVEKILRTYLEGLGFALPWDNWNNRLNRPGQGVP
jgi:hypothetical protein